MQIALAVQTAHAERLLRGACHCHNSARVRRAQWLRSAGAIAQAVRGSSSAPAAPHLLHTER